VPHSAVAFIELASQALGAAGSFGHSLALMERGYRFFPPVVDKPDFTDRARAV
jgi:hypothetical protein